MCISSVKSYFSPAVEWAKEAGTTVGSKLSAGAEKVKAFALPILASAKEWLAKGWVSAKALGTSFLGHAKNWGAEGWGFAKAHPQGTAVVAGIALLLLGGAYVCGLRAARPPVVV